MAQKVIKRRAVFAEIHQDTVGDQVHTFSVKYRKKEGEEGYKAKVSKSLQRLPGQSGFRQNVSLNHVLLLHDHEKNHPFEILIDLMVEYNGMIIDHTI
ncbi:hypothetical protein [Siphonobacter curvatus]|uniref:Uncharacterized protein n=1 Tax=Siphonobacter curvatus TaxID=2094562 RepID=A0A2S7IN46_9BACT|nr:hypothetical protein [Siphonobacter curvatus]PQA59152.1 hypothetical protein C5O19_05715 [Siphonobacter curvatus]